ncbi:PilZ domain-containing protein [Syntrophobacter fumaroxidans]|uniref:Type IV pilus assembly PilZ n=1 Tax=Syntrophobacter fumaroxidans (strain DSM 10017 / MPOB) TaxID=335543 RepID=A0LKS0_SYNFM|nr:PilZ domain-containing protein [Syntrophobacter fumaroxidans]ABK18022.1 type IV pilus assembly PilZ [Syntrophobacter fumaroxidans MPOB]HOI96078.1 PilZ domain-containing protein [Syntrophobacter fumaroxidans]
MTGHRDFEDLRRFKRFRMTGTARAAFFATAREFLKLGEILDISLGGLAMRYVGFGEQPDGPIEVELFGSSGEVVRLGRFPCRIVYDFELADESWGILKVRRCGIQFRELSKQQLAQIQTFIDSFGIREESTPPDDADFAGSGS